MKCRVTRVIVRKVLSIHVNEPIVASRRLIQEAWDGSSKVPTLDDLVTISIEPIQDEQNKRKEGFGVTIAKPQAHPRPSSKRWDAPRLALVLNPSRSRGRRPRKTRAHHVPSGLPSAFNF